jgi:hypothetical protein
MPTTSERGYGAAHDKRREKEKVNVEAGKAYCWRCTKKISPHESWDLGHDDDDRSKYMGPEHAKCNRATKRHKAGNVVDTSREW